MSFGGAFGGFGQNNNQQQQQPQQQGSGFGGGFGSTNNNAGGFGSTGSTGFGTGTNTGGGLFGGGTGGSGAAAGSGGFGAGGGFGSNNQSPFGGSKPFGATNTSSGGGLFGSGTTPSASGAGSAFGGFGGAGGGNNANNTSSPFGGGNTGGSLFGSTQASKPAFGSNTGGSMFGGTTSSGFGGSGNMATNTGTFGAAPSTSLVPAVAQSEGTASVPFQPHVEKEAGAGGLSNHFQSINFMQPYSKFSFEELRLADYAQGRRFGNGSNQAGAFGTNTGFGGFSSSNNSGGGGFGGQQASSGGLFGGSGGNTSTPFGQSATTPFGGTSNSNTTGLFGAKPAATGGVFGSQNTGTTSSGQAGGLFGQTTTNTSSSPFGGSGTAFGSNTSGSGGGGGLFGQSNQANKPGFSFGGSNQPNTGFGSNNSSTPFGSNNNTGGGSGLFGGNNNNTSSPFGGGQQQQGTSNAFGGLGQAQSQPNSTPAFGGLGGNNDQNKSGGLFSGTGTNNNAPGLFGGNSQQNTTAFGGNANQSGNTSSLFGAKPFGSTGTGTNTGAGGLFGQTNNTNPTGGGGIFNNAGTNNQSNANNSSSLFGANNQQQQRSSLFGSTGNTNNQAGGLFGNTGNNTNNSNTATGGSLFGASNNQNQMQQGNGGLMSSNANPHQNSQQNQQPQGLSTSITDLDPFGSFSLFNGLSNANAESIGPLATPLSSSQKMKKSALLPHYKFNPSSASRMITPQKRGYGFTYSTYGTPGSISSTASTPMGLSSSLLGSNLGRSLGKSLSTSNLRRNFDSDDSVLSPNAFSASSNRYSGAGSLKKLNINRGIRGDLFSPSKESSAGALPPTPVNGQESQQGSNLKKRVSFDTSTMGSNQVGDSGLTNRHGATPSAEEQGYLRSSNLTNGTNNAASKNGSSQPEMEQVKGNELAIVHEDETPPPAPASAATGKITQRSHEDQVMGDYWMRPSRAEIDSMPREKKKQVSGYVVGRHGCGSVTFDTPVDLNTVNLDDLYDNIVVIITRSATVYPDAAFKPPVGKGLNVPSTIRLENSWPRGKGGRKHTYETSGARFNKHMDRLRKVPETNFKSYDKETGTWEFTVDHFTTYGMDYDDDSDGEDFTQSTLSVPPDTPTPKSRLPMTQLTRNIHSSTSTPQDVSMLTVESFEENTSVPDDTFDFKKKTVPPGTFNGEEVYEDERMNDESQHEDSQSFLDDGSVGSISQNDVEGPEEIDDNAASTAESESVITENQEMNGLYPQLSDPTEHNSHLYAPVTDGPGDEAQPNSVFGLSQLKGQLGSATPGKAMWTLGDNWAEHLQRSISPRKQDRQALRESQAHVLQEKEEDQNSTPRAKGTKDSGGQGFNTSIDLMNSLFNHDYARKSTNVGKRSVARGKGFEWPYAKKSKISDDDIAMDANERAFHQSNKPSWGPDGTLVYAMPYQVTSRASDGTNLLHQKHGRVSQGHNVRFAKLSSGEVLHTQYREKSEPMTDSSLKPSLNILQHQKNFTEMCLKDGVPWAKLDSKFDFDELAELIDGDDIPSIHEKLVWRLAGVLFDDQSQDLPASIDHGNHAYIESRVRKERLSNFWAELVYPAAMQQAHKATSKEEEAIAYLSAHCLEDACKALVEGRNFRLATLIAMIGGDALLRHDTRDQLNGWRRLKILSELSEPIRTLYELLAGTTCVCEGEKGPLEDRARSYVISDRFDLDWRRSFGLRLWYGIREEEPAQEAIRKFIEDLDAGKEDHAKPVPYYREQGTQTTGDDQIKDDREDLLWGLLKLFADKEDQRQRFPLEDILMPQNYQVSPLEFRLAWQLYQNLSAHQSATFAPAVTEDGNHSQSNERVARLTLDYAWQLECADEWMWALFVLLHLEDPEQRAATIKSLISRHADNIGDSLSDPTFKTLTTQFFVPEQWIWEAKALRARSVDQGHVAETEYLLKARNWEEAHKTLCRSVAPRAIIADDVDTLGCLLSRFENIDLVPGWGLGGQVYLDYLQLLQLNRQHAPPAHEHDDSTIKQKGLPRDNKLADLVKRLTAALPSMGGGDGGATATFQEKVAVQEIGAAVARAILENRKELEKSIEKAKILSLPLTGDRYLRHSVDLSLSYYKAVMAITGGGR
ncbi:MAG: hypothetical protein M1837_004233 [Sclerophora amabilis]|nr:MAG: hypothetical protein M1837_004233 [Sclerophora amabilis]